MHHSADGFVLASAKSIVVCCQFLDAQGLVGSAASLYRFARHVFKACNTDELTANTNAANVPCHISTFLCTVELPTGRFFDLVYVFVIVFVGVLVKVRANFVKRSMVFVQQGVKCFLEESESTLTFSLSCLCNEYGYFAWEKFLT